MAYLLDTNILLRTISPNDPMHIETVAAIDILNASREQVVIAPQNLIELWNVCTRPTERNGKASLVLTKLKQDFQDPE